jgi:hypothetical protein
MYINLWTEELLKKQQTSTQEVVPEATSEPKKTKNEPDRTESGASVSFAGCHKGLKIPASNIGQSEVDKDRY